MVLGVLAGSSDLRSWDAVSGIQGLGVLLL